MKAVVRRAGKLVCDDVPAVRPGTGQVLLRSLACGICGSDLHALNHADRLAGLMGRMGFGNQFDPDRDVVFGHEFCGEVLDYGPDTKPKFASGTRVVAMPLAVGPTGLETIGYSNRFPGAFAEQLVATADALLPVPDGVPLECAAMVEPMAVGIHGVSQAALDRNTIAMVIGCGPIGLAVIAALKAQAVAPIIASDFSPVRRALAHKMGADIVIDPGSQSPHEQWASFGVPASVAEHGMAKLSGRSLRRTVVFECVGVPGMLQNLLECVPPETQIIVLGACMEMDRIEPILGINKQLNLKFASFYSPDEFELSLRRIAEGTVDVAPLITSKVGRGGVAGAFEALRDPESQMKIILDPQRA